jgi:hypothetical protein
MLQQLACMQGVASGWLACRLDVCTYGGCTGDEGAWFVKSNKNMFWRMALRCSKVMWGMCLCSSCLMCVTAAVCDCCV